MKTIILAAVGLAVLAGAASGAPPAPQLDLGKEIADLASAITIMQNEVLNNEEEEYIVLGNSGYFDGFNDAMTDAIAESASFALTGNEAADFSAIEAVLDQDENDALDSDSATSVGQATAFEYAIAVLNIPFDRFAHDPGSPIKAQGGGSDGTREASGSRVAEAAPRPSL
jgi:hypothetical protein